VGTVQIRLAVALAVAAASPAVAADLSGASFTSRGGHVSVGGSGALAGTAHSGGGSAGQSEAIGPTGSPGTLTTQAGGFWPIVRGAFPSLDRDSDGRQAFLDSDDDNDGLADLVETDTGYFVSASNTGTDPNNPDTDGDGFVDGAEVLASNDPNDPQSPGSSAVPSLPWVGALVLALALLGSAARPLRGEVR
jgi:hypothetical protein